MDLIQYDGKICFFGEFVISKDATYQEALDRLFSIGCEIGGFAQGDGTDTIKVYGCYERGYYELYWRDPSKGVSRAKYWTCKTIDFS